MVSAEVTIFISCARTRVQRVETFFLLVLVDENIFTCYKADFFFPLQKTDSISLSALKLRSEKATYFKSTKLVRFITIKWLKNVRLFTWIISSLSKCLLFSELPSLSSSRAGASETTKFYYGMVITELFTDD